MEVRSLPALAPVERIARPAVGDPLPSPPARIPSDAAAPPVAASDGPETARDKPAPPHEARYVRDDETHRLVLSLVDADSGEVIAQLPSKAALRAQAYANEVAARAAVKPSVARIA